MVKRILDIALALIAFVVLALPMIIIAALVRFSSSGPAIYWSDRIGRGNVVFRMPKFRTMWQDTPAVATHLLHDPHDHVTPIGRILRRTSLDETPQLWSILRGDMSFVGPRPALYNQDDLIAQRTSHGLHQLVPGLTGWAQVNGRDELPIPEKVRFECEYSNRRSFWFDLWILVLTAKRVFSGAGVQH